METDDLIPSKPKIGRPKGSKNRAIRLFKKPELHIKKGVRKAFEEENSELVVKRRRGPGRLAGLPENISTTLPTVPLRRRAYREYCEWISQGKSPLTFIFRCGNIIVTYRTLEKYREKFPEDMPEELYFAAMADAQEYWESAGEDMMWGKVPYHDGRIWGMFMKNKFKWETASADERATAEVHIKKVTAQLTELYENNLDFFKNLGSRDPVIEDAVVENDPD